MQESVVTSGIKIQRNDCSETTALSELTQSLSILLLLARNVLIKHHSVKELYQLRHIHLMSHLSVKDLHA